MNINELIKELQKYPQDTEVVTDKVREIPDGYYKANLLLYYKEANILVINHKPSYSWHDPDIYHADKAITSKSKEVKKSSRELPFKIISIFSPKERLNELEEIPKTEDVYIDYWAAAQQLCAKDGGRLPTMAELAQLASYIYGQEIGELEDNYDVEVKNHIDGLDPSEAWFRLWSSSPHGTEHAYYRYFSSDNTYYHYDRNYSTIRVVCLGDE